MGNRKLLRMTLRTSGCTRPEQAVSQACSAFYNEVEFTHVGEVEGDTDVRSYFLFVVLLLCPSLLSRDQK